MAIVAVSIAPNGVNDTSLSKYVAKALEVIKREERVRYRLDPMFTTLEGDLNVILPLVGRMHEALADMGAPRISTVVKIDDRRDKDVHMNDKVESVEQKLGKRD
ncbi:MTH1187 family thiamine-binding protein [bacterium]|nr:MTH1187 family thiamine-binding protein [bacterium]